MSNSVVGFDLGSLTSYVVVARQGVVESVANEYSDRNTPTCVSFNEKIRFMGHEAKQQQVSNVSNTICYFNRFIGKTITDQKVINESKRQLCKVVSVADQRVGFQVNYLGAPQVFTAEQIYAMQLTKMKEVAEKNLENKVVDIVINVPTNSTDNERRAVIDAAKIANLNCLKVINDTTACALAYGFYRNDFPESLDKPKIIAFVDMGHCNLQSALVGFNKGKMRVISSSCESVGGRDFDSVIYNKLKAEFKEKYKLEVRDNGKEGIRLMSECEKLKKLMSANSTSIPLNIECFTNDIDVSSKMNRAEFEELSKPILARVKSTLQKLLREAGLTCDQVDSVEIVGGATRVSAVKEIIAGVFKRELRTSLNSDEAVAKGCALQCAILSPTLRAKEFEIIDVSPYPIELSYLNGSNGTEVIEVFPKLHCIPTSKQLTFYRNSPFKLEARYSAACKDLPISNRNIGVFNVCGVKAASNGELSKVHVDFQVNSSGIFSCSQAQQTEEMDCVDVEGGEVAKKGKNKSTNGKVDKNKNATPLANSVAKVIDLSIESMSLQYATSKISEYNKKENDMIAQVRLEKEKAQSKNSVEEYVYEMRERLCGDLGDFVKDVDKERLCAELTTAEEWLYDEGEDVERQLYVDRLNALHKLGDVIVRREREHRGRGEAVGEFNRVCAEIETVIEGIDGGKSCDYGHLSLEEKETLVKTLQEKRKWLDTEMKAVNERPLYEDPSLTVEQINGQRDALEMISGPIVKKPRPQLTEVIDEKPADMGFD